MISKFKKNKNEYFDSKDKEYSVSYQNLKTQMVEHLKEDAAETIWT